MRAAADGWTGHRNGHGVCGAEERAFCGPLKSPRDPRQGRVDPQGTPKTRPKRCKSAAKRFPGRIVTGILGRGGLRAAGPVGVMGGFSGRVIGVMGTVHPCFEVGAWPCLNPPDAITEPLARHWKQQRVNILPGVTARGMANLIDQFDRGYLRSFALACDEMVERDDTLSVAVPKLKRRVSRCRYEVVIPEDVPEELQAEAERHQAALKYFYSNLSCENAVERNERGGLKLLIRRVMNAPLQRFAVGRILWRPSAAGLTATVRHVPLAFFDNTTGALRWAGVEGNTPGTEITDPQNWLIAVSDTCLMKALSICYIFKRLPLQDALNFCQRFGIPTVHGETNATPGSAEWDNFVAALKAFANDQTIATTLNDKIHILETAAANGEQVFGWIIEAMKRAMVTICCGSDLATMSRENGAGASLQDDDADEMTADYCEWVSETFNEQFDRRVIEDAFGEGVQPLAYFKLLPPQNTDAKLEMAIDEHVTKHGVRLSVADVAERFGRTHDADAETPPADVNALKRGQQTPDAANEAARMLQRLRSGGAEAFIQGVHADLRPLVKALLPLVEAQGANESRNAAATLNLNLTSLEDAVLDGSASTAAMQTALAVELLAGLASLSPQN